MSGDAARMGDELLLLAKAKIPDTREWKTEIHLERGNLPASRNKFLACNAAELLFAWLRNDRARVTEILDWWQWFATTPFTAGEDLTPEEVYRGLQAYSSLTAAAVALRIPSAAGYAAAIGIARAHAAWLLLGAGCGPARKVREHHLDRVGKPVVLVGDGAPVSSLPYIAQAGKRGWIRNRQEGPKMFLFAESVGLSAIVGQAAGLPVPRKPTPWQVDLLAALQNLSPGLPPFGFSMDDQSIARAYLANPTEPAIVRHIVGWLQPPSLPFTFVRYEDGSIVSLCEHASGSSTDSRMIDAWFADGRSMKTSADDGLRADSPSQRGFELGDAFACQLESGGTVMTIPRPRAAEVWRVRTCDGQITLTVNGAAITQPQPLPAPPPAEPVGCGKKPRKPLIGFRSKKAMQRYREALTAWEACRRGRS